MPILDGNVIRVLTRLFAIDTNPREKETNAQLWQIAETLVHSAESFTKHATRNTKHVSRPNSRTRTRTKDEDDIQPSRFTFHVLRFPCSALNQSLMELGALLCTPR